MIDFLFFVIWLLGAGLCFAFFDLKTLDDCSFAMTISFCWPLVLAAIIVIAPILLLLVFGIFLGMILKRLALLVGSKIK